MIDVDDDATILFEFLKFIPDGKTAILGIEDSRHPQRLTSQEISAIIDEASRSNPAIRLGLSTKGGFENNTATIDSSSLEAHDQWLKIANLLSTIS